MSREEKKKLLKHDWPTVYPHGKKKFLEAIKRASTLGIFEVEHDKKLNMNRS